MESILWFVLLVVFIMAEASTVAVVSMWFAAGALAALVAYYIGADFWIQVVVFIGVSGVLLASLRPVLKKYFTPRITKTNVDSVIGMEGLVCEEVDNLRSCGRVKLGAMEWSARSTSGESIPVGTKVVADRIEGVKVFVTPVEVPVTK